MTYKAKDIRVAPISRDDANRIVRKYHYSGKIVPNSQLHLGVFLNGVCLGVMQFGPSMDKKRTIGLVRDTPWNGFLELNRMAFSDLLPRNSESRALSVAFRIIKKEYPHVKWIISFSDATQCGDGTIYRAAGFVLTGIKRNSSLLKLPDGSIVSRMTLDGNPDPRFNSAGMRAKGAKPLNGFQIRYIYFLDPDFREKLSVQEIPFSKIAEIGASMYKGQLCAASIDSDAFADQAKEGGVTPTAALHSSQRSQKTSESSGTADATSTPGE